MPLKRSRTKTEQKFQDAVLELVAQCGCGSLGINAVAQVAGADKVLIYRYFGDFDGLLKTVAESRHWAPEADDILNALYSEHSSTISVLRSIHQEINTYFRSEPCLLQLLRWRRADKSPLGQKFNSDWHSLWVTIPKALSQNLDYPQRQLWSHACSLLALVIEAELCGERIDLSCLEQLAEQLEPSEIEQYAAPSVVEVESLPTNLL